MSIKSKHTLTPLKIEHQGKESNGHDEYIVHDAEDEIVFLSNDRGVGAPSYDIACEMVNAANYHQKLVDRLKKAIERLKDVEELTGLKSPNTIDWCQALLTELEEANENNR